MARKRAAVTGNDVGSIVRQRLDRFLNGGPALRSPSLEHLVGGTIPPTQLHGDPPAREATVRKTFYLTQQEVGELIWLQRQESRASGRKVSQSEVIRRLLRSQLAIEAAAAARPLPRPVAMPGLSG